VIKIPKQSIAIAVLLVAAACDTQENKPAPVAKAPGAEQKAKMPSGKVEAPETKMERVKTGQRTVAAIPRDPFRPFTLTARTNVRRRDNLSPLERYELGQLKLVGIVWDVKNPTALVEDAMKLGYTVRIGTPIGANDGKVKMITADAILIEEEFIDLYGARKKREVSMKLAAEKSQ
jgi:type IV pilus assembly protein PilP